MSPQPDKPEFKFGSTTPPTSQRHIDPEDLTLYAMQLLSGAEAAGITQHIEHCSECRRELARIQGDLATYALAIEGQPVSGAARQRLLKQVSRERKIIPIAPPQPIAAYGRSAAAIAIDEPRPKRQIGRTLIGGVGWGIAAALAVASAFQYQDREYLRGAVSSQSGQINRLTAEAAQAHQLMDALTDPKAVRVSLTAKPPAKPVPAAGVTYNPEKGTLILLANNLEPLKEYKTYELWVIPADGSASIPAGTFHPDDAGNASLIMPDLPKGVAAKAFGITVEDEGGSQKPTLPIVMAGS